MNLFINGSNREQNCFSIINDLKTENSVVLSLANKDIKFCLGCNACAKKLKTTCVLNDYVTSVVYPSILASDNIVLVSPVYMSQISGMLKTVIDRLNPFYNHNSLANKNIYLILVGQASKNDNMEEIEAIVSWLGGVSEWFSFNFEFLDYFESGDINKVNNAKLADKNYNKKIAAIKLQLGK